MDRINRKLGDIYTEKIKRFKCDDTIQLSSDKIIIVKPESINNNRATYYLGCNNGIKNLKLSGEWDYAELTCGGQIIETIYPEIRDTFTSTLNGIPPTVYHERQLNVMSKSINALTVSYDTTIKNYGYDISMQCQIFQLFKNSINITSNTSINLYNYIILPTTMIAVKIPYKCKRVFITNDYINPYENPSEIVPFIYNKIKDMWILDTKNNPIIYDNKQLYIITKTPQTYTIDLFVENINIGLCHSGMYGCKFAG